VRTVTPCLPCISLPHLSPSLPCLLASLPPASLPCLFPSLSHCHHHMPSHSPPLFSLCKLMGPCVIVYSLHCELPLSPSLLILSHTHSLAHTLTLPLLFHSSSPPSSPSHLPPPLPPSLPPSICKVGGVQSGQGPVPDCSECPKHI
jgi:hypothetical protein